MLGRGPQNERPLTQPTWRGSTTVLIARAPGSAREESAATRHRPPVCDSSGEVTARTVSPEAKSHQVVAMGAEVGLPDHRALCPVRAGFRPLRHEVHIVLANGDGSGAARSEIAVAAGRGRRRRRRRPCDPRCAAP